MIKGIGAENFICKCEICGSEKVSVAPSMVYKNNEFYGVRIAVKCLECKNEFAEVF